jgi:thiol-disulfide isomerase/thioredoxin
MRRRGVAATATAVLGGALAGCAGTGASVAQQSSDAPFELFKDRRPAPQVTGTTLDGKGFDLAGLRGQVAVLNFWQSYCAPCRAEAPALQQVYAETKASGVRFVGVDVRDAKAAGKAFVRTFKIGYPSVYDQAGRVAPAFRDVPLTGVPTTLVVDRNGRVAGRIVGGISYSALHDLVTKIAAGR